MIKDEMPLVEAIFKYIDEDIKRYHMPGHKGGRGFSGEFLRNLPLMDLTEVPGLDDLNNPKGVIYRAQDLGARAFGADRTFFLVNGSTMGIHAMILSACPPGSSLIVPRNCHRSVINAMVLGDVRPIYIQPEYNSEMELTAQVSPEAVQKALNSHPDTIGVLLVSPNYYGMCAHVERIGDIVHKRDKILMVDEAHGAHFPFSPRLPKSSGEIGADIWVQSAHKTLPAFTQTGYLHIKGDRVPEDRVARALRTLGTSSPSYMLMASLDRARYIMETEGGALILKLIDGLERIKHRLKEETGVIAIEKVPCKSVHSLDPTRPILDFKGIGLDGFKADKLLRKEEGLQMEMADHRYGVFICTVVDRVEDLSEIVKACKNLEHKHKEEGQITTPLSISREIPRQAMSPREAFYGKREGIPLKEGMGRICAESIGTYPPGIPRFCPGELLDGEGIGELMALKEMGATLFGVDDRGYVEVIID